MANVARYYTLDTALGHDIDEAATQARYADGILELKLAKKASNTTTRITIQ